MDQRYPREHRVLEVDTPYGSIRVIANTLTEEQVKVYSERFQNVTSHEEFLAVQEDLLREMNLNMEIDKEFDRLHSFFSNFDKFFNFQNALRPFQNLFFDALTEQQIDRQIERLQLLKENLSKHKAQRQREAEIRQQKMDLQKQVAELEKELQAKNQELLDNIENPEKVEELRKELQELKNRISQLKQEIRNLG